MRITLPIAAAVAALSMAVAIAADGDRFTGPRVFLRPGELEALPEVSRRVLYLPDPPYRPVTDHEAELCDGLLLRVLPASVRVFTRQYFGHGPEADRRIQVRGLCPELMAEYPDNPWWNHHPVDLTHTGACVFKADIDIAKQKVLKLEWGTPY